jgi:hypothetical protein
VRGAGPPRAMGDMRLAPLRTRNQLLEQAQAMVEAAMARGNAGHSHIFFDGPVGGYGRAIDGLEGFARTFLLEGFILKGSAGRQGRDAAEWYARGIATGVNPSSPERWIRLDEHPQAKVEAASLALILDMTRDWIWNDLSDVTKQLVIDYLSPAVGDRTYPRINWVWFRLVVETFLKSVGGPYSEVDMQADLETHDSFVRANGWLADGDERSFDHYTGWALHLYPTLWARMRGAEDMAAARGTVDRDRLDRYLTDALALVGSDGSPLLQGRSLTYRFAAAAPFWVGALAGVPSHRPGALRHAALAIIDHFAANGSPDQQDLLTIGWHHPWPALAQAYSGPGSPYWASKGMLGLALEAEHPVWSDAEVPLPVEQGGVLREVRAPGWLISGTHEDGIVRVVNHGTDHARPDDRRADSPLYARLGYSTVTSPLLDERSWRSPLDQSVCLVDANGDATHRAGMVVRELRVDGHDDQAVGVAVSESRVRWVTADEVQQHHGSGYTGRAVEAGTMTVISLVRGAYEVRLARVTDLTDAGRTRGVGLRIAGWSLACAGSIATSVIRAPRPVAEARTERLASRVYASTAGMTASISSVFDASPLGCTAAVPWLLGPVGEGAWACVMVELSGFAPWGGSAPGLPKAASFDAEMQGNEVAVTWPDGFRTVTGFTRSGPIPSSDGEGNRRPGRSGHQSTRRWME